VCVYGNIVFVCAKHFKYVYESMVQCLKKDHSFAEQKQN